jgi:hypothetical protein
MPEAGFSSSGRELRSGERGAETRVRELSPRRQPEARAAGARARPARAPRPVPAARPAPTPRLVSAAGRGNSAQAPSYRPGEGVPGRRTATIRGRGSDRASAGRRRPSPRRRERDGFRPERAAMWAVVLGVLLVLVAVTSSHAAVRYSPAAASRLGNRLERVLTGGERAPAALPAAQRAAQRLR